LVILEGGYFTLGFREGGHWKRLISYSPTLIFSLLHDLGAFFVDLNGEKRKLDLELLECVFFLILIDLYYFSFLKTTARGQMYQEPTPFFINSQNIPFSSLNDFSFSL